MEITVDRFGKIKSIRPQGPLKFVEDGDRRLRAVFEQASSDGTSRFVLDLSHVKYIDSNSLGQLVGALHHVRSQGGDIRLFGVQQRVIDAMVLVRLTELFEIFDTEAAAVASYVA
jgi:anti-sigma B factor antagonist